MNKYIRALVVIPCGFIKMIWIKTFHFNRFKGPMICQISPLTEITLDRQAQLTIGKGFKMRDGSKIRVRKDAKCIIGNNTSVNTNNIIACHKSVVIGSGCQFSPNVQIYDHDHDYRDANGIGGLKYKSSSVEIGNNVWIGANTVILRGTKIGNNCVVGAGCVLKGEYLPNKIIIQKKDTVTYDIQ